MKIKLFFEFILRSFDNVIMNFLRIIRIGNFNSLNRRAPSGHGFHDFHEFANFGLIAWLFIISKKIVIILLLCKSIKKIP